jgi:hypothetical protein
LITSKRIKQTFFGDIESVYVEKDSYFIVKFKDWSLHCFTIGADGYRWEKHEALSEIKEAIFYQLPQSEKGILGYLKEPEAH